jgi:hypothetical protein
MPLGGCFVPLSWLELPENIIDSRVSCLFLPLYAASVQIFAWSARPGTTYCGRLRSQEGVGQGRRPWQALLALPHQ